MVEKIVLDEGGVHLDGPGVGVASSPVGPVGDVPLLELLHDGLVELEEEVAVGLAGFKFVGEFDEAVEVLCLQIGHPGPAVDEGGFDHFEFLPGDELQLGLEVLDDEALEFAVGEPDDGGDHVVVAVGSSI